MLISEEIEELAFSTLEQSTCPNWYKIRQLRISASRAHNVKTRRGNFKKLVETLCHTKNYSTASTTYGLKMERQAFDQYAAAVAQSNCKVIKVGAIVKPEQPWLCCSPDEIVISPDNGASRILEIKCPYSCKDGVIIDPQTFETKMKYLTVTENQTIELKESSSIYTQVQILMYVTNLPIADLYVYSSQQSLILSGARNNMYLSEVIPKIQLFYFTHYLPYLFTLPDYIIDKDLEPTKVQ